MKIDTNNLIKSIFAGIMIGIAGQIYLSLEIKWLGAILFSIGLLVIVLNNYNLYTGKVGYIKSYKEIPALLVCLIGNIIGTMIVTSTSMISSYNAVLDKLSLPLFLVLLKSIGCGFLMYIAVDIYKERKSIVGVICCVPAFILAGFEHCIADSYYILNSHIINLESIIFLVIVIVGNAIGAFAHKLLTFK